MPDFKEMFEKNYPDLWDEFQKTCEKIQNIIKYKFQNTAHFWNSLSIRGSRLPTEQFERLEFLGDSLIKAVHGILLFEKSEEFSPKELSSFRSNLENNEYFGSLADELHLNHLGKMLGIGKLSNNQAADCFEAIIGAIFIDNGKKFDELIGLIKSLTHFEKRMKILKKSPWGNKDPKSFLYEWVQRAHGQDVKITFPSINEGTLNAPLFKVRVVIQKKGDEKPLISGPWAEPKSKKKDGEKEAAKLLLLKLKEDGKID